MAINNNCEGCDCGPSIPEPCITPPPVCPDPQPCVEIVNAECVKYTGPALLCNDVPIIPTNTSLADALAALVDLTCEDACCTIPAVTSIDDPDYIMLCVDDTAFCPYDGLLYNWFAINVAIAGDGRAVGGIVNTTSLDNPINTWRVPNNNDWQALVTAINPSATFTPWNNTAAGSMKSLTCWSIPNSAATNLTTLSVMPSVYRLDTGVFTLNNGQIGTYWGWDSVATATGYMYSLEFDDDTLFRTVVDKNQGLRLRLVRPAECNEDPGDAIPNAYKDNSGNLYNGVVIGNLVWLTTDLKDLEYNNGNVIPVEIVNATWAGLATGALCYPLNDTTYDIEYVIGCQQVKISFEDFLENLPLMPSSGIRVDSGWGTCVIPSMDGPEQVYQVNIDDTGWVNLDGFPFYTDAMVTKKPQVRRVGTVLHFRGDVFVPLQTVPGCLVPLSAYDGYETVRLRKPYVGICESGFQQGAVEIKSTPVETQIITFNLNNMGVTQPVIPTSVLSASTMLDNIYMSPKTIGTRKILLEETPGVPGKVGTALLSAYAHVRINADKTLSIVPLEALEVKPTDVEIYTGNSVLRNITSSVFQNEYVQNMSGFYLPNMTQQTSQEKPLRSDFVGLLPSNTLYVVVGGNSTLSDFSNMSDVTAYSGFNALYTTSNAVPNDWGDIELLPINSYLMRFGYAGGADDLVWPSFLDMPRGEYDCANADMLGGFVFNIDGMMAFTDINTDISNCGLFAG